MRFLSMLLLWPALAAGPSQSTPAHELGRISGRVLTGAGEPIQGATVTTLHFARDTRAERHFAAISGRDGGYELEGLPAGTFRVIARKSGYSGMTTDPGQLREGSLVILTPGSAVTGIDIVLRPTGRIMGRVLRPDGTPVARASVAVEVRQPDGRMIGVQRPVTTGADGTYRLEDVPQGSYVIVAAYSVRFEMIGKAEPAEYQDWARTYHPSAASFETAAKIEIAGGDSHDRVDVVLRPEPRFSVAGTVVDAGGRPVSNATIEFSTQSTSGAERNAAGGEFLLRGIRSGPLNLLAHASAGQGQLVGFAAVDVQGSSVAGARIVVGQPATVSGRVVIADGALDLSRLRIALATPWLRARGGSDELDTSAVARDGTFHVTGLIGPRTVQVIGLPGGWDFTEARRGGRIVPDARLSLGHGESIEGLEVLVAARPQ